jgi:LytR cell envelope-related transcriptional attenuator
MTDVSLGTARIFIIIALIAVGAAVLANGFGDDGAVAAPTTSSTPEPTDSASPTDTTSPTDQPEPTDSLEPQVEGVPIMVLNATSVTGLAAQAQDMLVQEGYAAPEDPADAPINPAGPTVVYFRIGPDQAQNKANARYMVETYFPGGNTEKLDEDIFGDVVTNADIQLVVQVGTEYADSVAAA